MRWLYRALRVSMLVASGILLHKFSLAYVAYWLAWVTIVVTAVDEVIDF